MRIMPNMDAEKKRLFDEIQAEEERRARALKHICSFLIDLNKDFKTIKENEMVASFYRGRIDSIMEIFPVEQYAQKEN